MTLLSERVLPLSAEASDKSCARTLRIATACDWCHKNTIAHLQSGYLHRAEKISISNKIYHNTDQLNLINQNEF